MSTEPPADSDIVATGKRVALRRWRPSDATAVHRACQDTEVQRWTTVPVPYACADAEWFVGPHCAESWADGRSAPCCLVTTDGTLVGSMSLLSISAGTTEIGYWTAPEMRGAGYTAEGLLLLARWAFRERGVERAQLMVEVGNAGSCATAERAGFTREGILRSAVAVRDRRGDGILYSLLPGDLSD